LTTTHDLHADQDFRYLSGPSRHCPCPDCCRSGMLPNTHGAYPADGH
jgi:hypothetical protein